MTPTDSFFIAPYYFLFGEQETRLDNAPRAGENNAFTQIIDVLKRLGKNLLVASAVPFYGLFYAGPRYVIQALPQITNYLFDKITLVTQFIFQNVIQPFWQICVQAVRFTATLLVDQITALAKTVFKYVIKPLWQKIIFPVLEGISTTVHFVFTKIGPTLEYLSNKIALIADWIFQNLLIPAIRRIGSAIVYVAESIGCVILELFTKVAQTALWIFERIIAPIWDNIVFPVTHFIAKTIVQCIQELAFATAKVASFIFQNIIAPVFNGIVYILSAAGNLLWNYVAHPILSGLNSIAKAVNYVSQIIFNHIITPVTREIIYAGNYLANSASELAADLWQTVIATWNQITFAT